MPLPTDRTRRGLETAARGAATLALLVALVCALVRPGADRAERTDSAGLGAALRRWSTVTTPGRIELSLAAPPSGRDREWLAALAGATSPVSWMALRLEATALQFEPRTDPAGGADLVVTAAEAARVTFGDTIGPLDSALIRHGFAGLSLPGARGMIDATVGAVRARGAAVDSLQLGRLLLLARAGWELKFTAAALEERGWQIDLHATVSPRSLVTQGPAQPIDTSRYAAVIALDSSAAPYAGPIATFVREGGGLVLWSEAARAPAMAGLAPGRAGAVIRAEQLAIPDSSPRASLDLFPIVNLDSAAVPLERRGSLVAVAARRIGPGRVILTGYADLWRWRMAGGDSALARHRDWLAALVSRVAYARIHPAPTVGSDVAPLATLIEALGPPAAGLAAAEVDLASLLPWLFALITGSLLLEWSSRRKRGVR